MKKTALFLALVILAGLLCGCGDSANDPGFDAVYSALDKAVGNSEMTVVDAYIENMIKLQPGDYEQAAVKISSVGTNIDEFGLVKAADEKQVKAVEKALQDYLGFRLSVWMDEYLPEELPKLQNAEVWTNGLYVCYAIVGDSVRASVKDAFSF